MDDQRITQQLDRRRRAVAEAWGLVDQVVVIGAGEPIPIPGRHDLTYPFRAHSEYLYLTDRNRPGGVLAFDPATGWSDFVAPVTAAERLWSGADELDPALQGTDALPAWLAERDGRPLAVLGEPVATVQATEAELGEELRFALSAVRRRKDDVELERMRAAGRMTAVAFAAGGVVPARRGERTRAADRIGGGGVPRGRRRNGLRLDRRRRAQLGCVALPSEREADA